MYLKWNFLLICVLLGFCESAYVETQQKCDIEDVPCLKNLIHNVLLKISETGIPESGIPSIDPIKLKNIEIPVLGLLNVTLDEGVARGVKDCIIDNIETGYKSGRTAIYLTCNLSVKGKFKIGGVNPLVQNMFNGSPITADGDVKLKIDNMKLKLEYFYHFIKKNGDVYFECHVDETQYEFEFGTGKIDANKIYLGTVDASNIIVSFLNQNLKLIMDVAGKVFVDTGMGIANKFVHNFFNTTPVKNFLTTDLSAYVKN